MKEAEEITQLTNVQLINILCGLGRRVATLENVVLELIEHIELTGHDLSEWSEYITTDNLKTAMLSMNTDKRLKTSLRFTNKRVTDLDNSHHGLVAYLNEHIYDSKKGKSYKY